jgi:sulfur carrier protein
MEILLNQQPRTVVPFCPLQQLLDELLPERQTGIAVAINNAVVPKTQWSSRILNEKDNIVIISATQGG